MLNAGKIHPLGISKEGRLHRATVYVPGAARCRIKQYTADGTEPAAIDEMTGDGDFPGIFTCLFEKKGTEYNFETETEEFADPFAAGIRGRERFAVRGTVDMRKKDSRTEIRPIRPNSPGRAIGTAPGIRGRFAEDVIRNVSRILKDDVLPRRDFSDMIIYKLQVRNFTVHESSKVKCPGTFKGAAQKLEYIGGLGVNTILLMPCYDFDEIIIREYEGEEKLNCWGYGADAFYFAPKASYASNPARAAEEFAEFIKKAHSLGIEVFMEFEFGSRVLSGIIPEILRFYRSCYHIDGFRLMGSALQLRTVTDDPYLKACRLILQDNAIPSGCGEAEFKRIAVIGDGFLKGVRSFLKGDEGSCYNFSVLIKDKGGAASRINYLSEHNELTINDSYCYEVRHNENNGERNLDGREINFSTNCGAEGKTGDKGIMARRLEGIKNALAALLLSQGVPLIMAGDEFGATNGGNNNPYCLDTPEGWLVWEKGHRADQIRGFFKKLTDLRSAHRVFSNRLELRGTDYIYSGSPDVSFHAGKAWYPDFGYFSKSLGILLNGRYALVNRTEPDMDFYMIFNCSRDKREFDLPTADKARYSLVLTSNENNRYHGGRSVCILPGSMAVFMAEPINTGAAGMRESGLL